MSGSKGHAIVKDEGGTHFVILQIFKSNNPTLSVLFGKGKILIRILKYITCFALACLLFIACDAISSPVQQKYGNHTVQKGETVFSIAQKYDTTREVIYNLNPDSRAGIKENTVLIVPSNPVINSSSSSSTGFFMHKVKRKETLFSISQQYGVSIDAIKKNNKELYARGLKKGEQIRIPKKSGATETTVTTTENSGANTSEVNRHTVAANETLLGIARMYGMSLQGLLALNPGLNETISSGRQLKVPSEKVVAEAVVDPEKFTFYEVKPKEGFFRLKVKLGLTEEEIVALNPYARAGLKDGMVLKIPVGNSTISEENVLKVDLENRISNKTEKNIALMLPFLLNRVSVDSVSNADVVRDQRTMQIALDFYSGALMAAEFAKDKGISVQLNVFDTEASHAKVSSIISGNNIESMDAVIGPLLSNNVEKAAARLKDGGVPVFSPLSNRDIKISPNVFQTLPSDALLEDTMITWLQQHAEGKNIMLISDAKRKSQKDKILAALPQVKVVTPREKGFLYVGDIDKHMARGTADNWVIVETVDPVILSNVVTLLNGMPKDYRVRMFTLEKNKTYDFDDISNMSLAKLNFTFPSVNKSYDYDEKNPFLISYKNKYGVLPNKYAVRGFDVTYDVLLRLALEGDDLYETSNSGFETEYIENKFQYTKKMLSGYQNRAAYILKYNQDLKLDVVK